MEQKIRHGFIMAAMLAATLLNCGKAETPVKLSSPSLRLADGSPISQVSTDEYNPYVVKMPDGFLVLVFGSDRSCGGCTAGNHNIFIARSVATYNDDAKLPVFNAPSVFTVGGTPLNAASSVNFVATRNSAQLRIYLTNAGVIKVADLAPAVTPYNIAALGSIAQFSLVRSTLLGIDAAGQNLFAKADTASQLYYFDPNLNSAGMTRMAGSMNASAVVQIPPAYAGQSDAFFALVGGSLVSSSHGALGSAQSQVAAVFANAKVSAKSLSFLHAGSKAGDLIVLSASEAGASLQDLYVLDGTSVAALWEQLATRPSSAAASAPDWTQPQLTATRVYGQNNLFTCNVINNNHTACTAGTPSDRNFYRPIRPSITDAGIFVADQLNNRALFFPGTALIATRVYCQAGSFTSANFNIVPGSQTCRGAPTYGNVSSIFADNTGVYLNDIESNRILYFSGTSIDAAAGAGGRVYGQAGNYTTFSVNNPALGDQSVYNPDSTTADATGVYVADTFNNRVLHFSGTSTTADRVYGQPNFTTNATGTTATALNGPRGVAVAPDGIYVVDTGNNRVLFFPGTSTTATRVYGQANFTSNSSGVTASALFSPWGIRYFGGGFYLADQGNHRILYFPADSASATRVWGQGGSFTANVLNNGGVTAASLHYPTGVDVDTTGLYVADNGNNRMLFYPR